MRCIPLPSTIHSTAGWLAGWLAARPRKKGTRPPFSPALQFSALLFFSARYSHPPAAFPRSAAGQTSLARGRDSSAPHRIAEKKCNPPPSQARRGPARLTVTIFRPQLCALSPAHLRPVLFRASSATAAAAAAESPITKFVIGDSAACDRFGDSAAAVLRYFAHVFCIQCQYPLQKKSTLSVVEVFSLSASK